MRLEGKTAVITGGGSGIGAGIAQALASEGCRVAIGGRREEQLRAVVHGWQQESEIIFHTLDVTDRGSVRAFFSWADQQLGRIDMLINSAGGNIPDRSMAAMCPEEWDRLLAVNATGAYNCLHAVLPEMRQRADGLIVNINSISGKRAGSLGGIAYNASKFAMTALGISVGNEEAAGGIRITNVYPGEVNTPILDQRPVPVSDEHRQAILQPEDIANLVVAIACLPPRAHVPEVIIKPLQQPYV